MVSSCHHMNDLSSIETRTLKQHKNLTDRLETCRLMQCGVSSAGCGSDAVVDSLLKSQVQNLDDWQSVVFAFIADNQQASICATRDRSTRRLSISKSLQKEFSIQGGEGKFS